VFHPNSEPRICHDLTLQIISYQIKNNTRNHGSIGFFRKLDFGGEFGFWVFWPFPCLFFLLFGSTRTSTGTKVRVATREVTASGIPRVSNNFLVAFLFDNSTYCSDIVWSKEPLCIFLSFFFLFFFCFPPIFDWLILFSFEAHS